MKPDIKNNFVFRLGQLHIVFNTLKAIRKLINGSGLDQASEQAGKLVTFHYSLFCINFTLQTILGHYALKG